MALRTAFPEEIGFVFVKTIVAEPAGCAADHPSGTKSSFDLGVAVLAHIHHWISYVSCILPYEGQVLKHSLYSNFNAAFFKFRIKCARSTEQISLPIKTLRSVALGNVGRLRNRRMDMYSIDGHCDLLLVARGYVDKV